MVNFGSMLDAQNDLVKKITEQKEAEALKKEKEALQTKLDKLDSSISKLEDKVVAQSMTNTQAPAPAPAKSMTLMHVGLLVGGLVVGYLITKMVSK